MKDVCRWAILCVVGLALAAPMARGEEGEGGDGRRRPGGEFRRRMTERRRNMERMRALRGLNMPMGASEKAQAELKRHRTALQELDKAAQALRADVKKAIEGGTEKEAAIKANIEKAQALAGRILAEYATHLTNMSKITQEDGEAVAEKLGRRLLLGDRDRPRRRRPRRPEGGAEGGAREGEGPGDVNPFND